MKKIFYTLCFLGLVLLTTGPSLMAQNYNKLYDFNSDFINGIHTATVKTTNNNVVSGGTLTATGIFAGGNSTLEITVTNPSTGNVIANHNYFRLGFDLELVDLIESDITPNKVLVVANATNPNTGKTILVVFKTNPLLGITDWIRYFAYPSPSNVRGSAITSDKAGNYFILSERETSNTVPGLIKIDDNGVDLWKIVVRTKNIVFKGVDLICAGNRVIIAGSLSTGAGLTGGMLVAEIEAATGVFVAATNFQSLNGDPNLRVMDLGLEAGVSTIVGNTSNSGFILQVDGTLAPGLAKYYTSSTGEFLQFTGIKQTNLFNSYVSFDFSSGGDNHPGIVQLNFVGAPTSNLIFNVDNYKNSSGLINLNGNYLIKGATIFGPLSNSKMSFTAAQTPLIQSNSNCSETLSITSQDLVVTTGDIKTRCEYDEVLTVIANNNLNSTSIQVIESDCPSAAPNFTKSDVSRTMENQLEVPFTVYPNPSTGLLSLEFDQEYLTEINQLDVFNPLGEVVLSVDVKDSRMQIDLSEFSGVYFLSIKRKDGSIAETKRVSIQ